MPQQGAWVESREMTDGGWACFSNKHLLQAKITPFAQGLCWEIKLFMAAFVHWAIYSKEGPGGQNTPSSNFANYYLFQDTKMVLFYYLNLLRMNRLVPLQGIWPQHIYLRQTGFCLPPLPGWPPGPAWCPGAVPCGEGCGSRGPGSWKVLPGRNVTSCALSASLESCETTDSWASPHSKDIGWSGSSVQNLYYKQAPKVFLCKFESENYFVTTLGIH